MPALPSRRYTLANRTRVHPNPSNHTVIQPRSNPTPARRFIGQAEAEPRSNPSSNTLEFWFPSEAITHFDLPLPSAATEDSAYLDVGRWLKATCSGVTQERAKLDQLIKWRCELLAGRKPSRRSVTCPEFGLSHSAGRITLVYGSSDQRVNPIGYYIMPCLEPNTNNFVHINRLTSPLTVQQLRSDNWLWAALRHRIARRPQSKSSRDLLIEEALMGIDRPGPSDSAPAALSPSSGSSASITSSATRSTSSVSSNPGPSTSSSCTLNSVSSPLFLRTPHRNASPPTPPPGTLIELDEEEDLKITGWTFNFSGTTKEKCALATPHQSTSNKRKSRRPLPPVTIEFHLVGDDIVSVDLPTTKRGVCLGTHTALLRDEGVLKTPVVWILSPTDKDVNSIWVAHKWSRSIPVTQNPIVLKTYKSTITAFDRAL